MPRAGLYPPPPVLESHPREEFVVWSIHPDRHRALSSVGASDHLQATIAMDFNSCPADGGFELVLLHRGRVAGRDFHGGRSLHACDQCSQPLDQDHLKPSSLLRARVHSQFLLGTNIIAYSIKNVNRLGLTNNNFFRIL